MVPQAWCSIAAEIAADRQLRFSRGTKQAGTAAGAQAGKTADLKWRMHRPGQWQTHRLGDRWTSLVAAATVSTVVAATRANPQRQTHTPATELTVLVVDPPLGQRQTYISRRKGRAAAAGGRTAGTAAAGGRTGRDSGGWRTHRLGTDSGRRTELDGGGPKGRSHSGVPL